MKKIEVHHTPDFMKGVTILVLLLFVGGFMMGLLLLSYIVMLIPFVFLPIIIGITCYTDYRKTVVEYSMEKICWKWLWCTYTVNFNDMESVHYTIISERTRYGYIRRFEIVFKIKDDELRLNDRLETEDIENCVNGKSDDIKLMQLYKFIENICPEKSKGFIKS